MRSVSSPQPELELVVLKSFKPIVGSGGGCEDGADSEFVKKSYVTLVKFAPPEVDGDPD